MGGCICLLNPSVYQSCQVHSTYICNLRKIIYFKYEDNIKILLYFSWTNLDELFFALWSDYMRIDRFSLIKTIYYYYNRTVVLIIFIKMHVYNNCKPIITMKRESLINNAIWSAVQNRNTYKIIIANAFCIQFWTTGTDKDHFFLLLC